jgi:pimeloyl-ACP methyl ester carboxylesterase
MLLAPLFFAAVPGRLWAEIRSAMPERRARQAFVRRQLRTMLRAPLSPSRMAARALLLDGTDPAADCAAVTAPTLVVTGEAALDFAVTSDPARDYGRLIAGARTSVLEGTGHLGSITQPEAFARVVTQFLERLP